MVSVYNKFWQDFSNSNSPALLFFLFVELFIIIFIFWDFFKPIQTESLLLEFEILLSVQANFNSAVVRMVWILPLIFPSELLFIVLGDYSKGSD